MPDTDEAFRRSLGERIRTARQDRSQKDVADALGVSIQAVWQWEAGKTSPSIANLAALCALLGVDLLAPHDDGAAA